MKKRFLVYTGLGFLGTFLLVLSYGIWFVNNEFDKLESDDPLVWESVIKEFERQDKLTPAKEDAVLFIGSSSIRFWRSLKEDMHPFPVLNRGFGGAKLNDIIYYADRLIFPYKPKRIVLFAGTNDITGRENDKTPNEVLRDFIKLDSLIHTRLPNTQIFYLPITPTKSRSYIWPLARKANNLISNYALGKDHITYIETSGYFLDDSGNIKGDLFWWDGVHLNKKGYQVWARLVRKAL